MSILFLSFAPHPTPIKDRVQTPAFSQVQRWASAEEKIRSTSAVNGSLSRGLSREKKTKSLFQGNQADPLSKNQLARELPSMEREEDVQRLVRLGATEMLQRSTLLIH